jgi:putative ABC transport system permease protein
MVVFLSTLVILMTAVTALGIIGLATFQVNARRKQIGTRRALGARRADIVRHFQLENGLLGAGGVVAGGLLAYAASGWLTRAFQMAPLPPAYVAASALALLVLGQLAVLWPARRAGAIDPAVATRTV